MTSRGDQALRVDLETLIRMLEIVLLAPAKPGADLITLQQARFVVALGIIATFLSRHGADENIVRNLV